MTTTKKILSTIFIIGLCSCIREKYTVNESYLCNNTFYKISVLYYRNGSIDHSISTESLPSKSCILKSSYTSRENNITIHDSTTAIDSVVITYDDGTKIKHYDMFNKDSTSGLIYTNSRNILNSNSWSKETTEKRNKKLNKSTYTFSEQDYLNAKNK
ncbi:MAG: hypothetical protein U0V72_01550 [Cytophagales bacterium]